MPGADTRRSPSPAAVPYLETLHRAPPPPVSSRVSTPLAQRELKHASASVESLCWGPGQLISLLPPIWGLGLELELETMLASIVLMTSGPGVCDGEGRGGRGGGVGGGGGNGAGRAAGSAGTGS